MTETELRDRLVNEVEIEVTEEMIEAGAEQFHQCRDLAFYDAEGAVVSIFKAMAAISARFRIQKEP